jgi:hypothetical protein
MCAWDFFGDCRLSISYSKELCLFVVHVATVAGFMVALNARGSGKTCEFCALVEMVQL